MLSRVADSLYWMSRYLERAEHTARVVDVNLSLMLDDTSSVEGERWLRVLRILGRPEGFTWTGDAYGLAQTILFDSERASSIISCVMAARENARQVREQISSEQWWELNRLYLLVTRADGGGIRDSQPSEALQSVQEGLFLFQGVTDSTMSHGEGWHFIQCGKYIERASAIAVLLDVYTNEFWPHPDRIHEGSEYLEWIGLLRSCTAFEAYCRVYTADISPERILEFLLLNPEFPHSIRFAIDTLSNALETIRGEAGKRRALALTRQAGRLKSTLSFADIGEIVAQGASTYLLEILRQCQTINRMIYQLYINYSIEAALTG